MIAAKLLIMLLSFDQRFGKQRLMKILNKLYLSNLHVEPAVEISRLE